MNNLVQQINIFAKNCKDWMGIFYTPAIVILKILLIILVTLLLVKVGSVIIRRFFEKQKLMNARMDKNKIATMSTMLSSVYRYTIYIICGVVILSEVFNLKSILAAAGIGGVAIGLGVQSLVKDVVAGFFIILEDQFSIGDTITIDNLTGTVEGMEMRVTRLRGSNGDLYIIPNGEIKKVINQTRGQKAVIVDIPLAYSADINKAFEIADKVCKKVSEEEDALVEKAKVLGITEFSKECINMRITALASPNEQQELERKIRKKIKEEFDRNDIRFYYRNN